MLTQDLNRMSHLPYTIAIEADEQIIQRATSTLPDESSVIVGVAKMLHGAHGLTAHIRHEGRYVAEVKCDIHGQAYCEHHYTDAGHNVTEIFRVDLDGTIAPMLGEYVSVFG